MGWRASRPEAAPRLLAVSSLDGVASTAITGSAPTATAAIRAESPTPPQPITATRSPGRTRAVFHTAPTPVVTAQPIRLATSNGTASGSRTHERSGTTQASAKVDRKQ